MASNSKKENRRFRRVNLPLKIRLRDGDTGGIFVNFQILDLSSGGMFIRSDLLWEQGDKVELSIKLLGADDESDINVTGEVVRFEATFSITGTEEEERIHGMGIRFLDLSTRDKARIDTYLSQYGQIIDEIEALEGLFFKKISE